MNDTVYRRMGLKLAATVLSIASATVTNVAHAEESCGVDWIKVLVDLDHMARGADALTPPRPSARSGLSEDPSPQNMGSAWFGVAPRVTLVARDWASSTRLLGDRLSVVEQMRLSASTRMVVSRVRLSAARFTPFMQIGLGQWRVDRNYLPLTPPTIEIATQFGTGFELRLASRWQLAAEATATSLIRDSHTSSLPQAMLWGTFLASRVEF